MGFNVFITCLTRCLIASPLNGAVTVETRNKRPPENEMIKQVTLAKQTQARNLGAGEGRLPLPHPRPEGLDQVRGHWSVPRTGADTVWRPLLAVQCLASPPMRTSALGLQGCGQPESRWGSLPGRSSTSSRSPPLQTPASSSLCFSSSTCPRGGPLHHRESAIGKSQCRLRFNSESSRNSEPQHLSISFHPLPPKPGCALASAQEKREAPVGSRKGSQQPSACGTDRASGTGTVKGTKGRFTGCSDIAQKQPDMPPCPRAKVCNLGFDMPPCTRPPSRGGSKGQRGHTAMCHPLATAFQPLSGSTQTPRLWLAALAGAPSNRSMPLRNHRSL